MQHFSIKRNKYETLKEGGGWGLVIAKLQEIEWHWVQSFKYVTSFDDFGFDCCDIVQPVCDSLLTCISDNR